MDILLDKVDTAFAKSAKKKLMTQRFGLRECALRYDLDYISDIRELYKRNIELDPLCMSTGACTLDRMKELIQTL
jgi:hypothetical protein